VQDTGLMVGKATIRKLEAIVPIIGASVTNYSSFFDACRRKRHADEYDAAGNISPSDVADLLKNVQEFETALETWIKANHSHLA
jgi:hypothetical protein